MGDYWHCSPIKYQCSNDKKQSKNIGRDKAKNTFIKNKYGINILYLWEGDIKKRRDVCMALISEYIANCGKLDNYNSFNYNIDENGKLVLSDTIVYSYQEKIAC